EVASLVPPDQPSKLPVVRAIHERLARLPRREVPIRQPVKTAAEVELLAGTLDELLAALKGRAHPLLEEAAREALGLRKGRADRPATVAAARLGEFDRRLAGDLAEGLHRLREVANPKPITLADVPAPLRERHVGVSGKWLVRAFAREGLWDFTPLERFTRAVAAVDPEATGKPFTTLEGLRAIKGGLQRAGLYAFLVIVLVLWL